MQLQETLAQSTQAPVAVEVGEKHQPMWQLVLNQFLEHKMAVASAAIILFFILVAIFAPVIGIWTGNDSDAQNVFNRYKPPFTTIELSNDDRVSEFEKFLQADPDRAKNIYDLLLTHQVIQANATDFQESLFQWMENSPNEKVLADLSQFSNPEILSLKKLVRTFRSFHLLGTDELGRDVLMRLIYGTRVSISVGILVSLAAALIGLLIGALAGFYGGILDAVLMRIVDSLLSLPLLPVLIVFAAADLSKLPLFNKILSQNGESVIKVIIILCLFSWMTVARLVRGSILSLREQEFILAARTLGVRDSSIILTHMVPNVLAPLLVTVTLNVGQSILTEASLSFLGLGIQPPTPSWGNMLTNAQELISQAPLLAIIPGFLIFIITISFNFVGDGLQEAIDPKALKR